MNTLSYCWSSSIANVMIWCSGSWKSCGTRSAKFMLKFHFDQMFIIDNDKVLLATNIHGKIKGYYKDDVLLLVLGDFGTEGPRKVKFQIKSNIFKCYKKLAKYFPIVKYGSKHNRKLMNSEYENMGEVLKRILEKNGENKEVAISAELSLNENFVKLCLLDPEFSKLVNDTQSIIQNFE